MRNAGVGESLIFASLHEGAKNSKALPFRFIAAARAVPQWEPEIDKAMLQAMNGIERISGKTVILVDNSGSMDASLSAKSDLMRRDAAYAVAILTAGVCEKTKLIHVVQKIQLGLSYDDVLLIPQYSEVGSRNDVDLSSKLTSKITLKIPIISANMSNVTGSDMAISIGKIGGLGVIPRFMSQEDEANLVSKVKKQKLTIGAAIGIRNGMFGRAETLLKAGADILFLDVAHGHMQKVLEAVSEFKKSANLNQAFDNFFIDF